MAKALDLAIAKAAGLPEGLREQLGLDLLERIDALYSLRSDIQVGLDELDAGKGEPLDIDQLIRLACDAAP